MQSYSSKLSSYLMYFDANNLYGGQPLPYAEFQWVDDVADFNVARSLRIHPRVTFSRSISSTSKIYTTNTLTYRFARRAINRPASGKINFWLLYDKKRYVIHYRNLQQCTRHSLRIAKIDRVLQFTQSVWLRNYIEFNTQFRTRATNDSEKNLYTSINNAVFGKTNGKYTKSRQCKIINEMGWMIRRGDNDRETKFP